MNTTRKSTAGRKRTTADGRTAPAAPKASGPSEADQILLALALGNGGEIVANWDAWGQATGRPDVVGYKVVRTRTGVSVQATFEAESDEDDELSDVETYAQTGNLPESPVAEATEFAYAGAPRTPFGDD